MTQMFNTALLRAGILPVNASAISLAADQVIAAPAELGTVLSNLAYYGFAPSAAALEIMMHMPSEALGALWLEIDPAIGEVTGGSRNMSAEIVYQNFPREVLEMSEAGYWIRQTLMYLGLPKDVVIEDAVDRAPLDEKVVLKVLQPSDANTMTDLFADLVGNPSTWSDTRFDDAVALFSYLGLSDVDFSRFASKANAARIAASLIQSDHDITLRLTTPVDALRLISLLSGGDVRLTRNTKVASLKRSLRRTLVVQLDAMGSDTLAEAFAQRRSMWKQALMRLHPGDYPAPSLNEAYDLLYRSEARGIEAQIAIGADTGNTAALGLAASRPGIFARRLRHLHGAFGRSAFDAFMPVLPKLTVLQLARLERVFATLKARTTRLYTPKGQFSKAKHMHAPEVQIPDADISFLCDALRVEIAARIDAAYPQGFAVDPGVDTVKLAMNGQELSPYGRGTRFAIPQGVNFIRSMSYWDAGFESQSVWFDNGWNFFKDDWSVAGVTCWNSERFGSEGNEAGIFSGDPVSDQTQGKGAQAIDIYLDRLKDQGVRYAVWSTLCYSGIPFSQVNDVFACLQWGEDPDAGEIFEPSRAQMAFPLKSDAMTNVTAFIDLETRELVYLDAALPLNTQTALHNQDRLSQQLPALIEVIAAQPSVADILGLAKSGSIPVLRNDEDAPVNGTAYVFEARNTDSHITKLDLDHLLKLEG